MGIPLRDFVSPVVKTLILSEMRGKIFGIDTYNYLHAYLSIIRSENKHLEFNGHITSHISGFFFKIVDLIEAGIKPVFVFEGKPIDLKTKTLVQRRKTREGIEIVALEAKTKGDLDLYNKLISGIKKIDDQMINDLKELLFCFGIPIVEAANDSEAQIAYMCKKNNVFSTVSQDYDSLLFGSPNFIRNLFLSKKKNIGGRTVVMNDELISLEKVLKYNRITQSQLVDIAILAGTDYNDGIKNIGIIKGAKFIKKYGNIEAFVESEKQYTIDLEEVKTIRNIFEHPNVNENCKLQFNRPDEQKILKIMTEKFGFNKERVRKKLDLLDSHVKQRSLSEFF